MALETIPLGVPGTPSTAQFRQMVAALLGAPEQTFAGGSVPTTHGGAHGVVGDDDFRVTAQGSPNLTVNVAKGYAFVHGTSTQAQGSYVLHNGATQVVSITPDASLDRIVLIVAQVRDHAEDSSGETDNRIYALHGTPSGSPTAPALGPGSLVLAQVYVAGGATQITSGNISDRRPFVTAVGGVSRVSSTTRPTGAARKIGPPIYETDTGQHMFWTGTDWQFLRHRGVLQRLIKPSTQGGFAAAEAVISGLSFTVPAGVNRYHQVEFSLIVNPTASASHNVIAVLLRQGSLAGGVVATTRFPLPAGFTAPYPINLYARFAPTSLTPGTTYVLTTNTAGTSTYSVDSGSWLALHDAGQS